MTTDPTCRECGGLGYVTEDGGREHSPCQSCAAQPVTTDPVPLIALLDAMEKSVADHEHDVTGRVTQCDLREMWNELRASLDEARATLSWREASRDLIARGDDTDDGLVPTHARRPDGSPADGGEAPSDRLSGSTRSHPSQPVLAARRSVSADSTTERDGG